MGPRELKTHLRELDTNCNSSSFLKGIMKMANIDKASFGDHDKTDTHRDETGEFIPLDPGGVMGRGAIREPENKQEASFGGKTQRSRLKEAQVEVFYFNDFELSDGELYNKGKSTSLPIRGGKLRLLRVIVEILGKEGLNDLGFIMPRGKLMARWAVMLNRVEEVLLSSSDISKADDTELQKIMENAKRSMEDLIIQLDNTLNDSFQHPLIKFLGLDNVLRSIGVPLKVETAKRVQLKEVIDREKHKLSKIRDNQEYNDSIQEDIKNKTKMLKNHLKVRQESINLLYGRLTNPD